MRHSLAAAVLAIALPLASPALADKLSGMGLNLYGNYFNFAKANLPSAPVKVIKVGSFKVELQHTRLSAIKKAFGGKIRSLGGESLGNWLCYHTDGSKGGPAANTWFISNQLGGGEFTMIVAVEAASPDKIPADCDAAPAKFAVPDLGIPGLGATTADLKAAFGAASGSKISYRNDRPGGYSDVGQYIGYTLSGGKVVGYGAGETSIPTKH